MRAVRAHRACAGTAGRSTRVSPRMTRKRPEARAPAAGTSGTSQSTYCGEKLLAKATKPTTVAAAAISGSGRRRQQSQTTSATAARLTTSSRSRSRLRRRPRPRSAQAAPTSSDVVDPQAVEDQQEAAAEALDLEAALQLHPS